MRTTLLSLLTCCALLPFNASAEDHPRDATSRPDVDASLKSGDDEICPDATLLQNDDGSFEWGYQWWGAEVMPPDYGSWAEHYDCRGIICAMSVGFSTIGYFYNPSLDVYIWEDEDDNPGNALFVLRDWFPETPGYWPDVTFRDVELGEIPSPGPHFIGFWPNWPDAQGWFLGADEDGPGLGGPRTKIAPGLGYPTGWNHPNVVSEFSGCRDLAIREYCIEDPTATKTTTWGRIKALY